MFSLLAVIIASFLYVFFEWLFFISKPSFLSGLHWIEQLSILFGALSWIVILFSFLISILIALRYALSNLGLKNSSLSHINRLVESLELSISAIIFSALGLSLINNFTYTIFKTGPLQAKAWQTLPYVVLFLLMFAYALLRLKQFLKLYRKQNSRAIFNICILVFLLFCFISASSQIIYASKNTSQNQFFAGDYFATDKNRPNILLVSSDALSASELSVYGAKEETTPFLNDYSSNLLLFENAFANANRSAGSIVSMLTGKSPTKTRVLTYPDILTGDSSYQHLPNILRQIGYRSLEISMRYYADSSDLNLRNAFDETNFRKTNCGIGRLIARQSPSLESSYNMYFLEFMFQRLSNLLLATANIISVSNPHQEATELGTHYSHDSKMVDYMLDQLQSSDDPLFVHLHLLATHGPRFVTNSTSFHRLNPESQAVEASYQDAIRDFDSLLARIFERLSSINELQNTLIVIGSDHSQNYRLNERIPLMFYFPGATPSGRITENAQLMDIAPTILDFLQQAVPTWMEGQSLLKVPRDPNRVIITAADEYPERFIFSEKKPPYFHFRLFGLVVCNKSLLFDVKKNSLSISTIKGHTMPCEENKMKSLDDYRLRLASYLFDSGFKASQLPNLLKK